MKLVVIGASGFVGTQVVKEALQRGYSVTAVARDTGKIAEKSDRLQTVQADIFDTAALAKIMAGHDAVISAYNSGWSNPNLYDDFINGSKSIQEATKQAGVKRLLVVGGAGSLFIQPGVQLVDTPQFPAEWKTGATAARDYLNILKTETALDWTFLSPAIMLHPGKRTGQYRTGTEEPVFDSNNKCEISVEDLAVALMDEVEKKQFIRKRFTVGY